MGTWQHRALWLMVNEWNLSFLENASERLRSVNTVNRICDPSHVFFLGFHLEMGVLSLYSYFLNTF